MLPTTHKLEVNPAYRPFLSLSEGLLLTTGEVAQHFRFDPQYLHNLRKANKGPAFTKLSTGAVRYRHSELLEWEIAGNSPHLTIDRVMMAAATMAGIAPDFLAALEAHLRAVLFAKS